MTNEELQAENDKLRLLLATSNADCAYCGLPAARMAECASGFPGCARADDMLMDGTPTRKELQHECARLRTALTQIMEYDTFENSRDPRTLMAKEALR